MRSLPLSLLILTALISFDSNAVEPIVEPHAMIYFQMPLGGNSTDRNKHSFGFRMDRAFITPGQVLDYQQLIKQAAIFDFKMGQDGVQTLSFLGIDYLKHYNINRAEEDDDAGPTISGLLDAAPLGILIGAGFGIAILVGSSN